MPNALSAPPLILGFALALAQAATAQDAADTIYMGGPILTMEDDQPAAEAVAVRDGTILDEWRRLTTSDHLYYMSTTRSRDAAVHHYFSPYESPYDAYLNFMNVVSALGRRAGA